MTHAPCPQPIKERKNKKEMTHKVILESAITIFLQKGYEGTSMAEIAKIAKVSKGTLYNHFKSKEDLFTTFFKKCSQDMQYQIKEIVDNQNIDIKTALIKIAGIFIKILLSPEGMGLYRIIISEAQRFPYLADTFWKDGYGLTLDILSKLFTRAIQKNEFKKMDNPLLVAEQFTMMCQTHIVQRKRFRLPVKEDEKSIKEISHLTAESFISIYQTTQKS